MSNEYHITRASDWKVTKGSEISEAEWREYAHGEADLKPDPVNGPNSFIWSEHPEGSSEAWLDWSLGNIYGMDPDRPMLEKMLLIAKHLGARVVSDRNEIIRQ